MDRAEIIAELHQIAATLKDTTPRLAGARPTGELTEPTSGDASIVESYGFSSLDVLEYLLVIEERFDVVFDDEELTEQTLFSIEALATYIVEQRVGEPRLLS